MSGGDWSVLDLTADPVRGEPGEVRTLANASQQEAQRWDQQVQALRAVADEGSAMQMEGDFAPRFRQAVQAHPNDATPLARGRADAAQALLAYAGQLEQAKRTSQMALSQGAQARQAHRAAKQAYEQAVAQMNALPKVVPPQQYPYVAQQYNMLRSQAQRAWQAMQQAESQWKAARQRAVQAGEQAAQQERATAERITSAATAATAAARNGRAKGSSGGGSSAAGGKSSGSGGSGSGNGGAPPAKDPRYDVVDGGQVTQRMNDIEKSPKLGWGQRHANGDQYASDHVVLAGGQRYTRPQGMQVTVTRDLLRQGDRQGSPPPSLKEVMPGYDNRYKLQLGHLWADRLGGPNAPRNFVPVHAGVNGGAMRYIEGQVAAAVKEHGSVRLVALPQYVGSEPIPRSILYAWKVPGADNWTAVNIRNVP